MLSLYRPFDDLFRFGSLQPGFNAQLERRTPTEKAEFSPAVDIVEHGDHYEVSVELPGFKPEDIEVEALDRQLTLRGTRQNHRETEGDQYRRIERVSGSFERSFTLPKGTATADIEAKTEAGVLVISIPKPKEVSVQPHKIEVKGEGLLSKAKKVVASAMETPLPTQ